MAYRAGTSGEQVWLCGVLLLTATCASAQSLDGVKPLEEALGSGWRCALLPEGLGGPGHVYRVDSDKRVYRVGDFSTSFKPQRIDLAIGTISSTGKYGFDLLASLTGLKSYLASATAQANAGKTFAFVVSIPLAQKEVTYDTDPGRQEVRKWFATAAKEPNSAYFLVRETVSAPSVSYKMGSDFGTAISADASARKYLEAKVGAKGDIGKGFELNQTFSSPLRVCLLPEQIVISRVRLDGTPYTEEDVAFKRDYKFFDFGSVGLP